MLLCLHMSICVGGVQKRGGRGRGGLGGRGRGRGGRGGSKCSLIFVALHRKLVQMGGIIQGARIFAVTRVSFGMGGGGAKGHWPHMKIQ